MSTDSVRLERRSGQRFQRYLPLLVHVDGREMHGYAQDVSTRGLFLYTEVPVRPGTVVELTFTMPAEVTLAESMPVRARGRVLRTASGLASPGCGMAVQLDSCQYLPSLHGKPPDLARISALDSAGERGFSIR